jgi:glycosyltransferase involved in cell wall biosynthesis
MRVMLLVTDLERGGTPLRLARLACGLREAGVEVSVGCLSPPGPVGVDLVRAGVTTFACRARHSRDVRALWRLSEHVRRLRPDLIHATLTHANVAARLVGLYHRVPVLTSTATIEVERRWHRWAELLTAHLDRGHIVNGQAVAAHVMRAFHLPRERVFIVPPSVEPVTARPDRRQVRHALGIPEDAFVVLWAGRLDPVKRVEIVIQCAEILAATPVHFLIAGDGPDRPRIEEAVHLSSGACQVHYLGWRDDLPGLMAAADALLLPSRTEGMPNTVLQAMAAGLPVVASDIPSLRELSGDEERLLLVSGEHPQAFADLMLGLSRPSRANRLSNR